MRRIGAALGASAILVATALGQAGISVAAAPASTAGTPAISLATAPYGGASVSRLGGNNRYEVSVAVSRRAFADPAKAKVVYLVRTNTYGNTMAAGTLSDGPVLSVPGCGTVPTVVKDEVRRLNPSQVIALGTTDSLCDQVLKDSAQGRSTSRISASTRDRMAVALAKRAFPNGADRVYLAKGGINLEAMSAGMLKDGPILLTSLDGTGVSSATMAGIADLDPTTVVAIGSGSVVSSGALTKAAAGRSTSRLGGADRYATAVAIAKYAFPKRTSRAYLVRGDGSGIYDAAIAGMLTDGPVLLTGGTCNRVSSTTATFLKQRYPSSLTGVGSPASLCTSTLRGAALAARQAPNCDSVPCVALTFDDGPSWPTPTLLDTLARKGVPATFFVVGQNVDAYPQHTRRTYVEGHTVANHTWNHPELPRLTWSQQKSQLDSVNTELASHGIAKTTIMRPPYGSYDANTRSQGYPLIIWDVDPQDWRGYSTTTIRSHIRNYTRAGSIVLQHDIHINSVNAVPGIIDDLRARGFAFVTVPELVPTMKAGDIVYRRGQITRAGTTASPLDLITLDNGKVIGPMIDQSGIEGIAPQLDVRDVREGLRAAEGSARD